jgi:hypothetical protein
MFDRAGKEAKMCKRRIFAFLLFGYSGLDNLAILDSAFMSAKNKGKKNEV